MTDWRLPANRREAFIRFYEFHLKYKSHPGCVYTLLPAIADALELDEDQRAWLVWLNGNTQNAVTSLLLLEAAPRASDWQRAVDLWNRDFTLLEWDTDRRHQKNKFGEATEDWALSYGHNPAALWQAAGAAGWESTWKYAFGQPHMGRLSAWSMTEYARILLPGVPDAGTLMLHDKGGSRSHRNGIALVAGYESTYWDADVPDMLGVVPELEAYAEGLLADVDHPDAGRLTLESALCTYKSFHKVNRRYPNVYSDMMYYRIKKAEKRFGRTFDLFWETRRRTLPDYLRLEDCPHDPGLVPAKQNHYLETGEISVMYRDWPELEPSGFDLAVAAGKYGTRKD